MPLREGQLVTARVLEFRGTGAKVALSPRLFAHLAPKNLSWKRSRQDARDYFDIGEEILVRILSIKNRENSKPSIDVGFRETDDSPWPIAKTIHPEGSRTRGIIGCKFQFGLLAELPSGFDALIHRTEISWNEKPSEGEIPDAGDVVDIVIVEVDCSKERIAASIKQAKPNPYATLQVESEPLETSYGIVEARLHFGLLVRLRDDALGLIHRSRLPERIKDDFCVGDEVFVRILSVEVETQRVNLELDLERYYDVQSTKSDSSVTGILANVPRFREGSRRIIKINHYERNPEARIACIGYHGVTCCICGFSFLDNYGKIGDGYIHVHHLNPISEQDDEYLLDPVAEMRPVCANCHAMIHKRRPPYTIEEMRKQIKNPRSAKRMESNG